MANTMDGHAIGFFIRSIFILAYTCQEICMEIKGSKRNEGIRLLVERGREAFRIQENINFYSEKDYKIAEKKFIKFCVIQQRC